MHGDEEITGWPELRARLRHPVQWWDRRFASFRPPSRVERFRARHVHAVALLTGALASATWFLVARWSDGLAGAEQRSMIAGSVAAGALAATRSHRRVRRRLAFADGDPEAAALIGAAVTRGHVPEDDNMAERALGAITARRRSLAKRPGVVLQFLIMVTGLGAAFAIGTAVDERDLSMAIAYPVFMLALATVPTSSELDKLDRHRLRLNQALIHRRAHRAGWVRADAQPVTG